MGHPPLHGTPPVTEVTLGRASLAETILNHSISPALMKEMEEEDKLIWLDIEKDERLKLTDVVTVISNVVTKDPSYIIGATYDSVKLNDTLFDEVELSFGRFDQDLEVGDPISYYIHLDLDGDDAELQYEVATRERAYHIWCEIRDTVPSSYMIEGMPKVCDYYHKMEACAGVYELTRVS